MQVTVGLGFRILPWRKGKPSEASLAEAHVYSSRSESARPVGLCESTRLEVEPGKRKKALVATTALSELCN